MKQKLIPYAKKIGIAFVITYLFFIVISSLAFQFYIKPNLNNYKSRIEILASEATGQTIKINSLEGRWDFINPEFALNEVVFYDSQNNTTLALKKISADFSWLSPFYLSPTLSEIKLKTPKLLIRRDMTNKIFIGGIPIDGPANNKLTNWLLNQKKVSIEQGEIDWLDEYKQAPVLTLKDLNLAIKHLLSLSSLANINSMSILRSAIVITNLLVLAEKFMRKKSKILIPGILKLKLKLATSICQLIRPG